MAKPRKKVVASRSTEKGNNGYSSKASITTRKGSASYSYEDKPGSYSEKASIKDKSGKTKASISQSSSRTENANGVYETQTTTGTAGKRKRSVTKGRVESGGKTKTEYTIRSKSNKRGTKTKVSKTTYGKQGNTHTAKTTVTKTKTNKRGTKTKTRTKN